jgi:hypothetical protein
MIYTETIMKAIAESEIDSIKRETTSNYNYSKLQSYKQVTYGKLIMLPKLGFITMVQYTELKELVENNGAVIHDEITNGGF